MRRLAPALVAFVLFAGILPAHAAVLGLPDTPAGFVTDSASLLSQEEAASLEANLSAFASSTGIEIAVVTVPSLQGSAVDLAAVELFEAWGIGDAEKDTGILFLVAAEDREARVEVGYGLEGALPDATASSILRNAVFPAFRDGRYGDGIRDGVSQIQAATQGEALPEEAAPESAGWAVPLLFGGFVLLQLVVAVLERSKSWWLGGVLGGAAGLLATATGFLGITLVLGVGITVALVLSGLLLDYVVSKGYVPGRRGTGGSGSPWIGGGGWGGGSGGGGFGGFGGGGSGGGGASGRW